MGLLSSNIADFNKYLQATPYDKIAVQVQEAAALYMLFPTPENKQALNIACTALTLKSTVEGKTLDEINIRSKKVETAVMFTESMTQNIN